MKRKTNFLIIVFFLGLVISGRGEPNEREISRLGTEQVREIELLRRNLRPFSNLSIEFTEETQEKGKWVLVGRHRLTYDFTTGFYKKTSVKRNKLLDVCRFHEETWDGVHKTLVDKNMEFNPELAFVKISNKQVSATISSGEYRKSQTRLSNILSLYNDRNGRTSLYSLLGSQKPHAFVYSNLSDAKYALLKIGSLECIVDRGKGRIVERRLVSKFKEEKFDYYNIKVEKTFYKDGWDFPAHLIFVQRSPRGEFVITQKITVVENSLAINSKLLSNTFKAKIPVGAMLLNNIEQTSHRVTELDALVDQNSVEEKMDNYMREVEKLLEKKNETK